VRCRFEFIGCGEELLVFEFELKAGEWWWLEEKGVLGLFWVFDGKATGLVWIWGLLAVIKGRREWWCWQGGGKIGAAEAAKFKHTETKVNKTNQIKIKLN
jgi:hypothetical protein